MLVITRGYLIFRDILCQDWPFIERTFWATRLFASPTPIWCRRFLNKIHTGATVEVFLWWHCWTVPHLPGEGLWILTKVQLLLLIYFSASSSWLWAPMDPSRTSSGCSGPHLDPNTCQTECQIECLKRCQIECQIECQIACQNRCQKECQSICQKECQTECQNIYLYIYIYAIYTSRWYVRNYVRIVCQGGDHSKKVFFFLEKYEEK